MNNRILLSLALLTAIGCGGSDDPWLSSQKDTVAASGYVTYNGNPLPNATIVFAPVDEGGTGANGFSDESGYFSVAAYPTKDGAVPGSYKVIVFSTTESKEKAKKFDPGEDSEHHQDSGEVSRRVNTVPARYSKAETTTIVVEVSAEGSDDMKIDLTD